MVRNAPDKAPKKKTEKPTSDVIDMDEIIRQSQEAARNATQKAIEAITKSSQGDGAIFNPFDPNQAMPSAPTELFKTPNKAHKQGSTGLTTPFKRLNTGIETSASKKTRNQKPQESSSSEGESSNEVMKGVTAKKKKNIHRNKSTSLKTCKNKINTSLIPSIR